MENLQTLKDLIGRSERIMLLSHSRPDGDALGSMGGLYWQLTEMGKEVRAVVSSPLPETIAFIAEGMDVRVGHEEAVTAEAWCDLIFCTDFALPSRVQDLQDVLESSTKPKLAIDHHENPAVECFTAVVSETEISSACELEYWVLKELYGQPCFKAGFCLMCGMTTDTNNFANSVFPTTLQMAGELLAAGIDRDFIIDKLYRSYRENRIRAFSHFTSTMKLLPSGIAYIIVSADEWNAYDLREGELEGLVNVPLGIESVNMSIYLREDGGQFRVSIRSKKGFSALNVARDLFHGGGHIQASGGKLVVGEDIRSAEDIPALIEKIVL